MTLVLTFKAHQLRSLRIILDRAMNTLEPQYYPDWLQPTSDLVDAAIEANKPIVKVKTPQLQGFPDGVWPVDRTVRG